MRSLVERMRRARMFAKMRVSTEQAGDGALLLRAAGELGDYPATVLHSVRAWAEADPGYPLIAERGPDGSWQTMSYGAVVSAAVAVAPVSVAYSLQSTDHARIRAMSELIAPGAVYADDAGAFGPALDAIG